MGGVAGQATSCFMQLECLSFVSFISRFEYVLLITTTPLAYPTPTTSAPQNLHYIFCGAGRGVYFLDIRLSFLANFLHQVHLYKYILYLCFGFVFFLDFSSVLQCILSGKYFTVSVFVYI